MIKHIHFVGIKGVGMAPLAVIAKEAGFRVTGSDTKDIFITDDILQKSGIVPFVGFDPSHVDSVDLVITTGAHGGFDNPEVVFAKAHNIPILTQGEAVGEFMKGELFGKTYTGISVAGTHGKTTTTAMIASIFSFAKKDPSWVVGTSNIPSLGFSGHFGKGDYFIAEADEYANEPQYDKTPKMLLQHPKIAVITNAEHDHPDVYPTIEDAYKAFSHFAHLVVRDGLVVACGDDIGVQQVLKKYTGKVATYGFSRVNTYHITNYKTMANGSTWEIVFDKKYVQLALQIPGKHNILNATAACIVAKNCGIDDKDIVQGLVSFTGTKRRMEYIGITSSGAALYDDYAHHPTEIQKTLEALREKYPNKKIVCIFQPHTYSRTKLLFEGFIRSLSAADEVILADIYPSAREAFDESISSHMLVEKLQTKTKATLAKTRTDVIQYANRQKYGENVVILTMGAGDIYQIANKLLEQ